MTEERKAGRCVVMSPAAIDRRLRDVSELYKLGMSFGAARRIGKVELVDRRDAGAATGNRETR